MQGDAIAASYLWGVNPVCAERTNSTDYFLYNAHGDVIQLSNASGTVTKNYAYDAFGNEKDPVSTDVNPFRYCGEYWDNETKTYYLRARYYDPGIGRFTQMDTHWNVSNMIYGDNPQKINEREDALGLKTYIYVPQITAILQAGNLYVYCVDNPIAHCDANGKTTYFFGFAFNCNFGQGTIVTYGYAWDDENHAEWQKSYAYFGKNDTASMGIVDAAGGFVFQITDADTIYDLYGISTALGVSVPFPNPLCAPINNIGIDLISLSPANSICGNADGIQFFLGYGFGVDCHVVQSLTSAWDPRCLLTIIKELLTKRSTCAPQYYSH